MIGNVWEWCWDWYGAYSSKDAAAVIDPIGPLTGVSRVLRGGAYWIEARILRSAFRIDNRPVIRVVNIGFRCVRGPRRQP